MKKATKGALAMVLVGYITFSVTNVLLADHTPKKLAQAHSSTNSRDQKKVDDNNQTRKTVNDQTSATDVKDEIQKNTTTIKAEGTTTNTKTPITNTAPNLNTMATGTTNTKTVATPVPATNSTTTPTGTTSANAVATPAQSTLTITTTTTNHGQQVSQAAKEKAASKPLKK